MSHTGICESLLKEKEQTLLSRRYKLAPMTREAIISIHE